MNDLLKWNDDRLARAREVRRLNRLSQHLGEIVFCPACGEPRAMRHCGDQYSCRACHLAGEISGFSPQVVVD